MVRISIFFSYLGVIAHRTSVIAHLAGGRVSRGRQERFVCGCDERYTWQLNSSPVLELLAAETGA